MKKKSILLVIVIVILLAGVAIKFLLSPNSIAPKGYSGVVVQRRVVSKEAGITKQEYVELPAEQASAIAKLLDECTIKQTQASFDSVPDPDYYLVVSYLNDKNAVYHTAGVYLYKNAESMVAFGNNKLSKIVNNSTLYEKIAEIIK